MKHSLAVALFTAWLALTACENRSPATPSTAPATAPAAAAPTTPLKAPVESSEPAASNELPDVAAAAGVSEMESDGDSPAEAVNAAQPLALRIAETRPAPPSEFKEGVHYLRLVPAQPTSGAMDQVAVTEAFWYGCPHCYALEPYLESWRKQAPSYIKFERLPVIWNLRTGAHARLYYTVEALDKLDALHGEIFREIHANHKTLDSAGSIETFLAAHGVAKDEFSRTFTSQAVEANLNRASNLAQRYRIESVPALIVNGKYVTDVGKAGGQEQLIRLVTELAAREHGV